MGNAWNGECLFVSPKKKKKCPLERHYVWATREIGQLLQQTDRDIKALYLPQSQIYLRPVKDVCVVD